MRLRDIVDIRGRPQFIGERTIAAQGKARRGPRVGVDRRHFLAAPQARAEFIRLSEQQPGMVPPLTMVGILSEALGETEEARKWYDRALRIDPRAATANNNLAWMYAEKGEKLDVALQLAQVAHEELPTQLEITDTLGWVYYKKGLYSQAIRTLQDCVQFEPANPIYHYHLGLAHAANGEDRRARIELEAALKIDPNFRGSVDARRVIQRLIY